jgi:actin-related protein
MEKIELIIQHIQTDQMSIDLGEYSVLITEPPLNPKSIREKTLEMM